MKTLVRNYILTLEISHTHEIHEQHDMYNMCDDRVESLKYIKKYKSIKTKQNATRIIWS